jgi:parallel beta-helix repeat protein
MRNIIVGFAIFCLAFDCLGSDRVLVVPDDYPTVQEAIAAATAGDTVEIKAGRYQVKTIVLKDGVSLVGEGMDEVTIWNDANCGEHVILADRPRGAIRDLTVAQRGKGVSGKVLAGIFIVGSSVEVSNCRVRDANDHGIVVKDRSQPVIEDCVLESNGSCGIFVYGDGAEPLLKGNRCSENKINGIYFRNAGAGTAEQNICVNNGLNGISVVDEWTCPKLNGNDCSENGGSGIYFRASAKGEATNNICQANKWHGISVADDGSTPLLKNNRCENNKRCGIYYADGANITARGNVLKNNGEINFRQLRRLLGNKEFDELEQIASKLRMEKSEFTNSNCQLNYFYYSLAERWSGYKPSKEEWLFGVLKEWAEDKPESITPRIVMARAYVDFAWHARGGDWARDVPEYAWGIFREKLEKAWEVMTEAEKLQEKDPELYRIFVRAGMGLDKSDEEMNELFEKGVAVGKWYYPLYVQRALSLLPRWGGEFGQLQAFASRSAELVGGPEAELLYTRIVAEMVPLFHNVGPNRFIELDFSYPRARQGHIAMLEKYPDATYFLNSYCLLACIYVDQETAKPLFERIGDDWDRDVWCKEEHFRKYRSWAYGEPSAQPAPKSEQGKKSEGFGFYKILDWLTCAGQK